MTGVWFKIIVISCFVDQIVYTYIYICIEIQIASCSETTFESETNPWLCDPDQAVRMSRVLTFGQRRRPRRHRCAAAVMVMVVDLGTWSRGYHVI